MQEKLLKIWDPEIPNGKNNNNCAAKCCYNSQEMFFTTVTKYQSIFII